MDEYFCSLMWFVCFGVKFEKFNEILNPILEFNGSFLDGELLGSNPRHAVNGAPDGIAD
jgi:hypothetical protein